MVRTKDGNRRLHLPTQHEITCEASTLDCAQFLSGLFRSDSISATFREVKSHFEFLACLRALPGGECQVAKLTVNASTDPISWIGQ